MATRADDDQVFRPSDKASVAVLRGLRARTVNHSFIHLADVCSAAPEDLVANLEPVPGTDQTDDGYNSVWYIYCPKRYKNRNGKHSGRRERAVAPAGDTCWHPEAAPKPVQGMPGATFCNLSYGSKVGTTSGQSFNRMGWCMMEYDDDTQHGGGGGDHVLCKVYRSSSALAKGKSRASASSSSSSSSSSNSKRKAAGDHPEAPPPKLVHDEQLQVQVQQDPAALITTNEYPVPCHDEPQEYVDPATLGGDDHGRGGQLSIEELVNIEEFNAADWADILEMLRDDAGEEQGLQQPTAGPEQGGEFVSLGGLVSSSC